MVKKQEVLPRSLWAAIVIVLWLFTSCSDNGVSVVMPRDGLHWRYNDGNVDSTDAAYYPPLEDGDTLYSVLPWGSEGMVLFILWPPPDSGCSEHLSLNAVVVGSAELVTSWPQTCEMDTLGVDTVHYSCDLGVFPGFSINTTARDTSVVLDFTFRVCCEDGGCLSWSEPISFAVIDTLSRSP
jgi:hypothetical protein